MILTEYELPRPDITEPHDVVVDRDGTVWYSDFGDLFLGALDPKTADFVLDLTRRIVAEQKLTTLMVTHSMRQALDCGSRTIMLHEGRIVFDVDAVNLDGLATYVEIDLTEDPVPAPTFRELQNYETGPVPKNGLMMKWNNHCQQSGRQVSLVQIPQGRLHLRLATSFAHQRYAARQTSMHTVVARCQAQAAQFHGGRIQAGDAGVHEGRPLQKQLQHARTARQC